ncbi:type III PLP-dependent enzyme [Nocardiopsis sp. CNT312]|uniref:type III PLP-dependent enzyme n=1 Tax=Nocardiopsis sp. CNT312 TaxID=1137268 RepID=UPI00049181C8|nr:type III PLP-dependent enzyme [Nocardiopsis sp. CNT312]
MSEQHRIQGIAVTELAERFGTPLYVYDGEELERTYRRIREPLHPAVEILYSLKANPNLSVCSLLGGLGAGAEVSSAAELAVARKAGIAPSDTIFLGPGKSEGEISEALADGVHSLICESYGELDLIDGIARDMGITAPVALRVNPVEAARGAGLRMGGKPRQFGIDEGLLMSDPGLADRYGSIRLMGVHAYLGTRILDAGTVVENTRQILGMAQRLSERLGFPLELVDFGGGIGVAYFSGESDPDIEVLARGVNDAVGEFREQHPESRVFMELGRYLTGSAGLYVARVRYVKESMGQLFAVADGGTNHHMAAVGIGSFAKRNFPMSVLNRAQEPADGKWNVTGPLCTPNDTLGKNVELPRVEVGDLIGVHRSGAYGPTASPTRFLSHGYPAEVLVHQGTPLLVHERESVADILDRQPVHEALMTKREDGV